MTKIHIWYPGLFGYTRWSLSQSHASLAKIKEIKVRRQNSVDKNQMFYLLDSSKTNKNNQSHLSYIWRAERSKKWWNIFRLMMESPMKC